MSKSDVQPCKHTEGPWLAASAPSSVVGWPVVGPQGRLICNLAWMPKRPDTSQEDWLAYMEECHGNANLIGAAVDMLAALKQIKRDNQQYNFGSKLVRIVSAAIAKAEGRS